MTQELTALKPEHYATDVDLLKLLIGKTIKEVRLKEKDHLAFICTDGTYLLLYTEGDCCSISWIEHFNGLSALIGQTVNNVVTRDMPKIPDRAEFECIECYGWTLETAAGRCDIEMRNESNGYYGGTLRLTGGNPLKLPLLEADY